MCRWALEAGFDLAGVARLEPSARGAAFREWLARGDQAGMEYMSRRVEVRLDPACLLPERPAGSVLSVALRYGPPAAAAEPEAGSLWNAVARYARGRDYHDTLGARLVALEQRIQRELPGIATRRYVDTGPLLERELAARAGLGWVGKNTMLIHPRIGSYFLLGEILLGLDLPENAAGQQWADLCGSCTRCLDACPTGALPEPYRLDARRCISYLTIEHRGDFPTEAPDLEGWVFGCDICQEVCPWNRKPEPVDRPEFQTAEPARRLTLADLVTMDRDTYVETFRGSPLKRAKLEGLRRNASAASSEGD